MYPEASTTHTNVLFVSTVNKPPFDPTTTVCVPPTYSLETTLSKSSPAWQWSDSPASNWSDPSIVWEHSALLEDANAPTLHTFPVTVMLKILKGSLGVVGISHTVEFDWIKDPGLIRPVATT